MAPQNPYQTLVQHLETLVSNFFSKFKTFSPCFLLASEISKVEFGPSWGENFYFKVHLHLAYPEITFHFHFYPSEIWLKKKVLNMFGEE